MSHILVYESLLKNMEHGILIKLKVLMILMKSSSSLTVEDLYVIMLPELYEIILPLLGYENDEWPEPGGAIFDVEWKKVGEEFVLKRTVYRVQLLQRVDDKDKMWHVMIYATAVPNIPKICKRNSII